MFDDDRALKHLAFFEELAASEQSDPAWPAVSAGLVVLRLIDAWVEDGSAVIPGDAWGVRAVRAAIDDIPRDRPVRAILGSIVDALERAEPNDMHALAPRLIAYARALEFDARWNLAADVYRTVITHSHPIEDTDFAIDAHAQLGMCLRQLGDLDAAEDAYRMASTIASAVSDKVGILRGRLGEGKVAIARGNLPRAEAILDETIGAAQGSAMRAVRVSARHDRAMVAGLRGDLETAIQFAYSALAEAELPAERDRILADIGVAFLELGVYSSASDAFMVLARTAQEQYVRWTATLNLLDIAQKTSAQPLFERYRRDLASAPLPPMLAAHYELYVGQGHLRFGQAADGMAALERALRVATAHDYNQLVFQIEEIIRAAQRSERRRVAAETRWVAPSEKLEGVARALRELREEVSEAV